MLATDCERFWCGVDLSTACELLHKLDSNEVIWGAFPKQKRTTLVNLQDTLRFVRHYYLRIINKQGILNFIRV